jgi:hypothetical protein
MSAIFASGAAAVDETYLAFIRDASDLRDVEFMFMMTPWGKAGGRHQASGIG